MISKTLWHHSWWSLTAYPVRSVALAVSFACAIAVLIFSAAVLGGFSATIERMSFGDYGRALVIRQNPTTSERTGPPTLDDQALLLDTLHNIEAATAWYVGHGAVNIGADTRSFEIYGARGDYQREVDSSLLQGQWISDQDMNGTAQECLLGYELAQKFTVVPDYIDLSGGRCHVAGILNYPSSRPALKFSNAIIAPFAMVKRYYGEPSDNSRNVSWLTFILNPGSDMRQVREDADILLRKAHGVSQSRLSPFDYDDPAAPAKEQIMQRRMVSRLLFSVTGATLITSLLSYCFITWSTLRERRREIALRVALGAYRQDIVAQVFLENLLVSVFGSALGLAAGITASLIATQLWGWPTSLSLWGSGLPIVSGWMIAAIVGIYAASKAARTPPAIASKQ